MAFQPSQSLRDRQIEDARAVPRTRPRQVLPDDRARVCRRFNEVAVAGATAEGLDAEGARAAVEVEDGAEGYAARRQDFEERLPHPDQTSPYGARGGPFRLRPPASPAITRSGIRVQGLDVAPGFTSRMIFWAARMTPSLTLREIS